MQLEIRDINKRFGARTVLKDVSLSLPKAHALAIIGPSGGGKSTLLRVLAGLEHPDSGSVSLNGEKVVYDDASLLRHRRSIGTVFQMFNLFPHLSALENITLPLEKVHGYARETARETALDLLARFQLAQHAAHRPWQLSGGQRQRVAIARAVAIKPRVLLFDEPTSALDPEMTSEVLDLIVELGVEGMDLILVTHEMGFARKVSDHVLFLADGQIAEQGHPDALFGNPQREETRRFLSRILKY
jgi:polar amino acid transport system ATP-binding protein